MEDRKLKRLDAEARSIEAAWEKRIKKSKRTRVNPDKSRAWNFYGSRKWYAMRKRVFLRYGKTCMKCKATGRGVVMQVDHIKPKSRFPHLAMTFNNLQVLCRTCNILKSNNECTDYRPLDLIPKEQPIKVVPFPTKEIKTVLLRQKDGTEKRSLVIVPID